MPLTRIKRTERRKQIAYEVLTGLTGILGAARKYDVSPSLVREACNEYGIDLTDAKQTLANQIAVAILGGETKISIMSRFGVSERFLLAISLAKQKQFLPLNTPRIMKIIADLLNTRLTLKEIAEQRSCSHATVSRVYQQAVKSSIPIPRRLQGLKQTEPRSGMDLLLVIDNSIDTFETMFHSLSMALVFRARIHILAGTACGSRYELAEELARHDIAYHRLVVTDDKLGYIVNNNIDIVVESEDDIICNIPNGILVLKPRNGTNFDFDGQKWLYSKETGELV